jgi:phage terminase large subunit
LCPVSPEEVYRYVNFLLDEKRYDDAMLITRTARKLDPNNRLLDSLQSQLQDYRRSSKKFSVL